MLEFAGGMRCAVWALCRTCGCFLNTRKYSSNGFSTSHATAREDLFHVSSRPLPLQAAGCIVDHGPDRRASGGDEHWRTLKKELPCFVRCQACQDWRLCEFQVDDLRVQDLCNEDRPPIAQRAEPGEAFAGVPGLLARPWGHLAPPTLSDAGFDIVLRPHAKIRWFWLELSRLTEPSLSPIPRTITQPACLFAIEMNKHAMLVCASAPG